MTQSATVSQRSRSGWVVLQGLAVQPSRPPDSKPQLWVAEENARDLGASFSIADLVADADYAREVARKYQEASKDGQGLEELPSLSDLMD